MPITTSPTHDVTKLMGRRNLGNIPKDQRSLLDGESSWAVDLKDGPHNLATVPDHVLQTLKEAFVRLQDKNDKEDSEPEKDSELPITTNDRDGRNEYSPGSTPTRSSNVPASSPERAISWHSSPARSRDDAEIFEPGSPIDETPASPLLAPLTQPPPPRAHATSTTGPSSSFSEPEDLEMEFPQAQENREAPINRVATLIHMATPQEPTSMTSMASTTDTPPCAQPQVSSGPCISSEIAESSVLPADPIHHRTRRMKPIHFDEDGPKAAVPPTNAAPFVRTSSLRAFPESNNQNPISLSSSTSAPFNDHRMEDLPPPPPPHRFVNDATPQNRTLGRPDDFQRIPWGSVESSPARQTPMHQLYRIQAAVDVPIIGNMEPYGAFAATYPDYVTVHSGNLQTFVQACCILHTLQEERLIREYLFDDFIRAWPGYITYAHNARAGQEPLPAIEWFNILRGPILFNRMCVNRSNLDTVLGAYPEDVARTRASMKTGKQEGEDPALEPAAEPAPEFELGLEPELDQEPEPEQEVEVVDLLASDSAMDIGVLEERRDEERDKRRRTQQRRKAPSPMNPPPPTRKPPSLPAPSRAAPPPPVPPPLPRPLSPELESDDFDDAPFPPRPASLPKPQPQSESRSQRRPRSRSRSKTHQPEPQPQPQLHPHPQPQPQLQSKPQSKLQPQPQPLPQSPLQPKTHRNLPQRQSPRRHPTSPLVPSPAPVPASSAPLPSPSTRRPPKSTHARSSPRPADYLGNLVSSGRSVPSSSSRPIPKPRKRTAEERARLKEHFRKKASSSSTSLFGSGS